MGALEWKGLRGLGWPALTSLAFAVVAYGSVYLTTITNELAIIWPANGIFLSALLLSERRRWPAIYLFVTAGSLVSNLASGTPLSFSVLLTFAQLIEISVVGALLYREDAAQLFSNPWKVGKFGLAVLAGALSSALILMAWTGDWNLLFMSSWMATIALGMVIVTPLVVSAATGERPRSNVGKRWHPLETFAILTFVLVSCLVVLVQDRYPALFLPVAVTLLATYRLGSYGAAASVGINGLVGCLAIAYGVGPLHAIPGGVIAVTYYFQFYLVVLLATALPLAALLAQRDRMFDGLVESNRWLAMAEVAARVGHWRVNLGDGSVFWSNEMYRIFGLDPSFKPDAASIRELYHPDDAEALSDTASRSNAGSEVHSHVTRVIRPDGIVAHVETHSMTEYDAAGRPLCHFGTCQDVTDRIMVMQQLEDAQRRAEAEAGQARRLADIDPLTGIASRRKIFGELKAMLARAQHTGEAGWVSLLDVDKFKAINDCYGHSFGDTVLQAIARCCSGTVGSRGSVGRFGGEEFLIVLPGANELTAQALLERLRRNIELLKWPDQPEFTVTASFGAAWSKPGIDETRLLHAADVALYEAKREGRNQLRIAA
ncbi:MAG TPA: diguanylate cyclase [Croceibacterium sp.]